MHPLLRIPYAALGAAAEAAVAIAGDSAESKWRRALGGRRGLFGRFEAFGKTRDSSQPLVWFHAPSAGEALQALPVHDRVRGAGSGDRGAMTALTFFSPSAEIVARKFAAEFVDFLPFDTARGADIAVDSLKPAALVYSKLDVWPILTERATQRRVPIGMISATLREASSRRGTLAAALLRDAYAALDLVGAIAEDDAERLVALGVPRDRIRVTGDTRYDQVWERAAKTDRHGPLLAPLVSKRPTLVAGSTWPADEAQLFSAWTRIRGKSPDARLVIAPHEPTDEHLTPIERWAAGEKLSSARLGSDTATTADVVIVDRVGVLGELYALGWAAFVGGGFHDAGLHSVLEPAAFGVPVMAGPKGAQNSDLDRLAAAGGGRRIISSDDLAASAVEWFEDHVSRGERGRAALGVIETNLGAADRAAELVRALWSTV